MVPSFRASKPEIALKTCAARPQTQEAGLAETLSTQESPPYVLEEQIGFLLRLAAQRHAVIFQSMAPGKLTPTQFAALVRLAQSGPCSQNELGRRTAMDVATIKGVVDRLKAKDMVTATSDPDDKRRSILCISPDYRAAVQELVDVGHGISKATLAPLTAAESRTFLRLLKKLG